MLLAGLLVLSACKHEPPVAPEPPDDNGGGSGQPCDPNVVYFEQQVLPMLISNCAIPGCHNVPTDENDDIQITSYATLMSSGIVQNGDFWEALNEDDPDKVMPRPPQAPLSQEQLNTIWQWLQQGAQNTSCQEAGCDTLNVTYSGSIVPIIQQSCQGCHSGPTPQGGLNLTAWSVVNALANDGRLVQAVNHTPPTAPMPPTGPKISACKIRQIELWVAAGAPNN